MNSFSNSSTFRISNIQILLFWNRYYQPLFRPSLRNKFLEPKRSPEYFHIRKFKDFYRETNYFPKRHTIMMGIFMLAWFGTEVNWPRVRYVLAQKLGVTEEADDVEILNQEFNRETKSEDLSKSGINKEKIGFRDRKIIEYENRIRHFSTPDKVFRYFATLQVNHVHGGQDTHEVFMTPDDFLRSMTPGIKQPEASKRHFEIAFRMFDLNGDGDVDVEEFEKVATLIRQQTSIGSRHRDHTNTGNTFKGVNSALTTYFFGENRDKKLTIEKFLEFQEQLQREILILEFQRKDPDENEKITEADFTELLLAYAGYAPKKKSRIIKRVKKKFKGNTSGITSTDYLQFFHFLNNINDVDTALTFYHIASASIDQATFKHVAKTVAHVHLSNHVIEVVFTIFDENQDGQLSNKEFIAVMKNRLLRGLEKPKDTGFVKFIQSVVKCSSEELFSFNYK